MADTAFAFAQRAPCHRSALPASFQSAAQSRPRSFTSQTNILSVAGLIATATSLYRSRILRQAVLSRNPDGLFRFITASVEKAQPIAMKRSTANEPFKVSNQVGVLEPLGMPGVSYWDPAGIASDAEPNRFRHFRMAELKHGRVAMLANLGLVVQSWSKIELVGNDGNGALPRGALAVFKYSAPGAWLGIIVLLCGFWELRFADDSEREPGNFGDPGELAAWAGMKEGPGTPGNKLGYNTMTRNYELNNGRLAMLGFIGSITAEYVTGLDCKGQWAAGGAAFLDTVKRTLPYSP